MSSPLAIGSADASGNRRLFGIFRTLRRTLVLSVVLAVVCVGQSRYTVTAPATDGTTTGLRVPNGLKEQAYHRSVMFVLGSEMAAVPTGTAITQVGFTVTTGAGIPVTGRLRLYLLNTIRGAGDLPAAWVNIPALMPVLYDGPFTIPDSAGPLDITLDSPFMLTGPGLYIAYDFESGGPFTTENLVVASSTALSLSIRSGWSATAAPAILSDVSNFRPALRFRFLLPAFRWSSISLGTTQSFTALDAVDDSTAWIGTDGGYLLQTTDRGGSWHAAGAIGSPVSAIVGMSKAIAVAIGSDPSGVGVLSRTLDGGVTWNAVSLDTLPSAIRLVGKTSTSAMIAVPDAVNDTITVLRSADRGVTWRAAMNPIILPPGDSVCGGTLCRIGTSIWFATKGSGGRLYQSANGVNGPWTFRSLPTNDAHALAFSAIGGTGICGAVDTIYGTTDGGSTWQTVALPGIGAVRAAQAFPGGTDFWIAGPGGIWHSPDDGLTWTVSAAPAGGCADLRFYANFKDGLGPCPNGILITGAWTPPTTGVERTEEQPDRFGLLACYPNPFNPATTVEYVVASPARVRLTVYNVLGQKIRSLFDGLVAAGRHRIRWDGTDDGGHQLSTGVYYCRWTVDGNPAGVSRLLLLR